VNQGKKRVDFLPNSAKMVTKIVALKFAKYKSLYNSCLHMHRFYLHRLLNPTQQEPSLLGQNQGFSDQLLVDSHYSS
jgi:hypothetical protein